MGPYRSTLLTVLTVVLGTVLAACGGGDATPIFAPPSPTAPTSATASNSGSQAPGMPAAATEHTKQGAIAFAKYYWNVADYSQATGDTRPLRTLTPTTCSACVAGLRFIDKAYSKGGRLKGGSTIVSRATGAPLNLPGGFLGYALHLTLINTKQLEIGPDGETQKVFPAATAHLLVVVRSTPSGWVMDSWQGA